jgi:hypothetical protein
MYHYTDGGLRNVWLVNGYEIKKTPYGERKALVCCCGGINFLLLRPLQMGRLPPQVRAEPRRPKPSAMSASTKELSDTPSVFALAVS